MRTAMRSKLATKLDNDVEGAVVDEVEFTIERLQTLLETLAKR